MKKSKHVGIAFFAVLSVACSSKVADAFAIAPMNKQLPSGTLVQMRDTRLSASPTADFVGLANENAGEGTQGPFAEETLSLLKANPEWNTDAGFDSVVAIAAKAFSGSASAPAEPCLEWALGEIIPRKQSHSELQAALKFIMSIFLNDGLNRGGIYFGHINEVTKAYESCSVIREFDPVAEFGEKSMLDEIGHGARGMLFFAKLLLSGTIPSSLMNPSSMAKFGSVGDNLEKLMADNHQKYGPKESHIYVGMVGADPEVQGRGYGKKLMTQITTIGDTLGKACYLECGNKKNRSFYEKFGFRVVNEDHLVGSNGAECMMYTMIREPELFASEH